MYRYIFGFDRNDPHKCAEKLCAKGINAVVADASAAPLACVFADAGIDLYLCYGAFGLGKASSNGMRCMDITGEERIWFSSGCPNDPSISESNLNTILDACSTGIKGVFVDGARFASFASPEGPDAFFTCFCPECMKKMDAMGFDPERICISVANLKKQSMLSSDIPYLIDWFTFRSRCIMDYMNDFSARVHAVRSDVRAGAFIFEPLLAPFVGQTYTSCQSLDIIAPMLYRRYSHPEGPACMNHEWAAFVKILRQQGNALLSALGMEFHIPDTSDPQYILDRGFSPEDVGIRIQIGRAQLGPGQEIWPILQIEDDCLSETDRTAFASGANAVGYFMYGMAELPTWH